MRLPRHTRYLMAISAALALFVACETVPEPGEIPEDLSRQEYFQRGQEAYDQRHYDTALVYYQTFIDRNPDDLPGVAAAEYEIAFIHYRQGELDIAETKLLDLLARYEGDEDGMLPDWPRILAERILDRIQEERVAS